MLFKRSGGEFPRMPRHSAVQPCARRMVRWHPTQDSRDSVARNFTASQHEQKKTSKVSSPLPLQRLSSMPQSMKSRWKLGGKRDESTQLKLFFASTSSPALTSSLGRGRFRVKLLVESAKPHERTLHTSIALRYIFLSWASEAAFNVPKSDHLTHPVVDPGSGWAACCVRRLHRTCLDCWVPGALRDIGS